MRAAFRLAFIGFFVHFVLFLFLLFLFYSSFLFFSFFFFGFLFLHFWLYSRFVRPLVQLPKTTRKKLEKTMQTHVKAHEALSKKLADKPTLMQDMANELSALRQRIGELNRVLGQADAGGSEAASGKAGATTSVPTTTT